jgi:hypothetical protein
MIILDKNPFFAFGFLNYGLTLAEQHWFNLKNK